MGKFRVYSSQEYDEATQRLAEYLDINTIENLNELDKRISQNFLDDIRRKKGTIYNSLKEYWKDYVKPEKETKIITKKITPRTQQRKFIKIRRLINRNNGIDWLKSINRLKIRNNKEYIIHKGKTYLAKNIVVYRHPTKSQEYITRRKTKRK